MTPPLCARCGKPKERTTRPNGETRVQCRPCRRASERKRWKKTKAKRNESHRKPTPLLHPRVMDNHYERRGLEPNQLAERDERIARLAALAAQQKPLFGSYRTPPHPEG